MLPPEAIEEFKNLYQKYFKELLSDQEATARAEKFLDLFRAVYRGNKRAGAVDDGKPLASQDKQHPDLAALQDAR